MAEFEFPCHPLERIYRVREFDRYGFHIDDADMVLCAQCGNLIVAAAEDIHNKWHKMIKHLQDAIDKLPKFGKVTFVNGPTEKYDLHPVDCGCTDCLTGQSRPRIDSDEISNNSFGG